MTLVATGVWGFGVADGVAIGAGAVSTAGFALAVGLGLLEDTGVGAEPEELNFTTMLGAE